MKRLLILCIVLLPFIIGAKQVPAYCLGIDIFSPEFLNKLGIQKKATLGIITNHTGKNSLHERTVDVVSNQGFTIAALFAPEHGLDGTIKAGATVANGYDTRLQLPVFSLYEHGRKKIPSHLLQEIDMLVFDIQDAGMRHYTYSATLLQSLELAAKHNKIIIVLDRPNPLGMSMEGPVAQVKEGSFLASLPLPLRHGMTMGEIARYCNMHVLKNPARLFVAPLKNYYRQQGLHEKLFTGLSPNIQSLASCKGYSFLGMLGEVKPFDVGIGTEFAFKRFGLPAHYLKKESWQKLAGYLKKNGLESSLVSYKRKGIIHAGLLLSACDINDVYAFDALLNVLGFCKKEKVPLIFSSQFDTAIGTHLVQNYINGTINQEQLSQQINSDLELFYKQAQSAFIYKPMPIIHRLIAMKK